MKKLLALLALAFNASVACAQVQLTLSGATVVKSSFWQNDPLEAVLGTGHTVVRNYAQEAAYGIDSLLVGKTPGATTQALYNSDGTRNTSAWFAAYAPYLTCVSSANTAGGWEVVAVTPQNVVTEAHVGDMAGATVTFTPADGTAPVTRVLGAEVEIAGDLVEYPLSSALPGNIIPASLLPAVLPTGFSFDGSPMMFERQTKWFYVGEIVSLANGSDTIVSAASENRAPWTFNGSYNGSPLGPAIFGDSTHPNFIIIGGRPVLMGCFYIGDSTNATFPDVGFNIVALQSAIGSAYTLNVAPMPSYPIAASAWGGSAAYGIYPSGGYLESFQNSIAEVNIQPQGNYHGLIVHTKGNEGMAIIGISETGAPALKGFQTTFYDSPDLLIWRDDGTPSIATDAPAALIHSMGAADALHIDGANGSVKVDAPGGIHPIHITDNLAQPDSVYFSSTQNKLCYKDSSGTSHPMY